MHCHLNRNQSQKCNVFPTLWSHKIHLFGPVGLSQTEMRDFPTLFIYLKPGKGTPFGRSHCREYPRLPDLKTEKKLRGCQRGAYIVVQHRVWIMKLLHDSTYDPLKQTKRTLWCFTRLTSFGLFSTFQWIILETNGTSEKAFGYFPGWKIPGRNLDFMPSNRF